MNFKYTRKLIMGLLMYKKMVSPPPLEEFIKFNEVALYDFLVDHKSRYAIYFKKMKEQMIDGENFMLLTKQTLEVSPLKFSVEMILLIEDLIKKLKNQEGGKES
ncbi:unnamed protein product [Rhizophagus irregularis]|uniref:Uncharacterized protein n=1 Tax=Rhizophagus irregularis TaxID=588596 RepID=A0A916E4T0_9GLOM|nr:unnamed protein product [Rhizophagus irregularis]CAB5189174.1 unnamed protein product [Rhizophagus irregularis]CAB5362286.1 unnamed protein product [Rhizophagus irregularis]